jgi:chromosome partitioning protein
MKTLVLASHQAAVGKSTVATILVHHLARHGHRVLAIDLAHPGALGQSLRRSKRVAVASLGADAFIGDTLPCLPDVPDQPIVLIDGARRWMGMERQTRLCDNFIGNLQDMVAIVRRHFDACVIDTSARPDVRQLAALACADLVLVPTPLDEVSIGDVGYLFWHARCGINAIQRSFNPNLRLLGLLPSMVQADGCQHGDRDRLDELAAKHQLIRVGGRKNADEREEARTPISEFAHTLHRPEIAQTLASGQMLWDVNATAARAVWNEIRPTIETLAARLIAPEVRP